MALVLGGLGASKTTGFVAAGRQTTFGVTLRNREEAAVFLLQLAYHFNFWV